MGKIQALLETYNAVESGDINSRSSEILGVSEEQFNYLLSLDMTNEELREEGLTDAEIEEARVRHQCKKPGEVYDRKSDKCVKGKPKPKAGCPKGSAWDPFDGKCVKRKKHTGAKKKSHKPMGPVKVLSVA